VRALVTGGGGFVGGAIVRRLLARGDEVVALQRGDYPWLKQQGAVVVRGDLANRDVIDQAIDGCDIVFHVAAKAGVWGRREDYTRSNVTGTENVVSACRQAGVARLVFTSSPSVVFDGRDENGIDESAPYPDHYLAHYPQSKAQAERLVLQANGDQLATVVLRPHLVWGPGDPHLAPRIIDRARAGKLKLVGNGENLVDSTYIDNAADAHILAGDQLLADGAEAVSAGKAYFISNGEPIAMAQLINRILTCASMPAMTRKVSPGVAYAAGAVLESIYKLLGIDREPMMTRFVARQLSTAHWFDISAAKRDLGYEPQVLMDQGMQRLAESLSDG